MTERELITQRTNHGDLKEQGENSINVVEFTKDQINESETGEKKPEVKQIQIDFENRERRDVRLPNPDPPSC